MAGNTSLNNAAKAKKDEFYTRLTDIEKELRHYRGHFKDQVVFCNCDDPFESNFFKYFAMNFNKLGLKKLIATCYTGSPIAGSELTLFDVLGGEETTRNKAYKAVVTKVYDASGNGAVDMFDVAALFKTGENELVELEGDGDFRSDESLELMDQADIVVTNPPFSLFREYVATLMEHEKKFVIIGPQNAIAYKEIFPLLMNNKVWLGYGFSKGDAYFKIPEENVREFASGVYDAETGMVHFRNCNWFTNMDIKKRHDEVILVSRYKVEDYLQYDNYDGIEVSKVVDIPCDYDGTMGVPITFLNKYSPEQFEILGIAKAGAGDPALKSKEYPRQLQIDKNGNRKENVTKLNDGPAIKVAAPPSNKTYYTIGSDIYIQEYARILIRNRHPEAPRSKS